MRGAALRPHLIHGGDLLSRIRNVHDDFGHVLKAVFTLIEDRGRIPLVQRDANDVLTLRNAGDVDPLAHVASLIV
jgi:hypothetical protein